MEVVENRAPAAGSTLFVYQDEDQRDEDAHEERGDSTVLLVIFALPTLRFGFVFKQAHFSSLVLQQFDAPVARNFSMW